MRERSAGWRFVFKGTSKKAPACRVTGTRAFPALHVAIFDEAAGLLRRTEGLSHSRYPGSIGAAFHPTSRSH
jgi:hypothetical protein